MVLELISWKHSFDRINEEYEIVQRKKQALDNLLNTGKISQSTYDSFSEEMNSAVAEIEKQQKALLEKMNLKVNELEQQVKILEMLLANFEIQHATGEIDEEIYNHKTELLSMGLEAARQELDVTKESVSQFSGSVQITEAIEPPTPETIETQEVETQPTEEVTGIEPEIEVAEETVSTVESEGEGESEITEETTEETGEENLPEYSVASVETGESESLDNPPENPQETLQNPEESQSTETDTQVETQEEYQTEYQQEENQEQTQEENQEQTQEEYQTE
jgi:hypothetical protein